MDIAVLPWVQPEIVPIVAAAGKHMLCQKPLAMDYATGVLEVETAERAGVLLAVNHQMRWDAGIAASRDLVAQGALGRVTEAQVQVSVSTPLHLWAWIAESPHLDIKIHSTHYLDALRSILGDPEWVTSIHGRYPEQAPVIGETVTKTILEYRRRGAGRWWPRTTTTSTGRPMRSSASSARRACWRGPSASCTTTPTAVPTRSRSTARGARSRPSTSTRDGCPMPSWVP